MNLYPLLYYINIAPSIQMHNYCNSTISEHALSASEAWKQSLINKLTAVRRVVLTLYANIFKIGQSRHP